jgi:hypothetical protein
VPDIRHERLIGVSALAQCGLQARLEGMNLGPEDRIPDHPDLQPKDRAGYPIDRSIDGERNAGAR